MMDPPWQLATANPTRGVALGYSQVRAGLQLVVERPSWAPGQQATGFLLPLGACAHV